MEQSFSRYGHEKNNLHLISRRSYCRERFKKALLNIHPKSTKILEGCWHRLTTSTNPSATVTIGKYSILTHFCRPFSLFCKYSCYRHRLVWMSGTSRCCCPRPTPKIVWSGFCGKNLEVSIYPTRIVSFNLTIVEGNFFMIWVHSGCCCKEFKQNFLLFVNTYLLNKELAGTG